jgi:hypothetical protein
MATTTPNFGLAVPTSSDLVKNGAVAIETLGDSIDASLVDLKGGTTGQVLAKATNTDMDFSWVAQDDSNAIQNAIVDAKGDLISATAADTPARLAVGTNNQVLTADSTTATGLKWATPATTASGLTLISRTSFSGVASQAFDNVFTDTYTSYIIRIENIAGSTGSDDLLMQFRYAGPTTDTTGYYGNIFYGAYNSGALTYVGVNNGSATIVSENIGTAPSSGVNAIINVQTNGSTSYYLRATGTSMYLAGDTYYNFNGRCQDRVYTGFLLKASTSTSTSGTVSIYGMAKS